jgi:hypothetical protein
MRRRCLPGLLLPLLLAVSQAAADPLRLVYRLQAGGMTVLELEAALDLEPRAYRMEAITRTRGLAAVFFPGEQRAVAEGGWAGERPLPATYRADGVWRGQPRRVALRWLGAEPAVTVLEPPNEEEREKVPIALRRGTLDALSALAQLSRQVAQTGRCDVTAAIFDGRRRVEVASRTESIDRLPPWRDAWAGDALRCSYESRTVAGFRLDDDRDRAAEPQRGIAWVAPALPGAPPLPVRVDLPSRWFGTVTAYLVRAD